MTGQAGRDKKYEAAPDFTAENLAEAVTVVLNHESEILEVTE